MCLVIQYFFYCPDVGGSAAQSELIHHRIRTLAKETNTPVFTFAEDIAASGGCAQMPFPGYFILSQQSILNTD